MKMIGFEASFRRGGLRKQYLEHPRGNPHHALIFADTDTEFDEGTVGVPAGIGREAKEHGSRACSANVLSEDATDVSRCRVLVLRFD
jgi:hypothetical protein